MPPLRGGRASKACDLCRKNKTRCYANDGAGNTCLRCHTLSLQCSLDIPIEKEVSKSPSGSNVRVIPRQLSPSQRPSTDLRLERLERTVGALVDRFDAQFKDRGKASANTAPSRVEESRASTEQNPAPVILIRDAATDAGVSSPEQLNLSSTGSSDVISAGLVTLPTAHSLLELFRVHYGRWVRFSDDIPTEILFMQVRKSPLLLCSVLLIAVRHTTQELADELAPPLFREAKNLISQALLLIPEGIEHYQATLILSLWSTTIGQQPLSIDSWLLTGYALQQGFASRCFPNMSKIDPTKKLDKTHIDNWCLWNHLCVAHLQYCVGTRRQTILTQEHIDQCLQPPDNGYLSNYETRMVAEVKLYWVIYRKCSPHGYQVNLPDAIHALEDWKKDWQSLFDEPRSQFLQMGFHFAHLLAYYQSARSPQSFMDGPTILDMIELSRKIINLAIDTTDDRTRHLTDHIYHIVTFSALTMCRLVYMYEDQLLVANIEVDDLDHMVIRLIAWLRSIGLPCHAAHLLSDIVSSQFQKLRPAVQSIPANNANRSIQDYDELSNFGVSALSPNIGFLYPDLIGSELFDIGDGTWPQWS